MLPINLHEIPNEIIDYIGQVKDIRFPRQGHTSDVGIIKSERGCYILKRTRGDQYCSWLSQEIHVLGCLQETQLPIPSVYQFVEEKDKNQAWALVQFFEGETLRQALMNEKNCDKKHELIFNFGAALSNIHRTPCPKELIGDSIWLDNMLRTAEYNLKHYSVDGTIELLGSLKNNKPQATEYTLIHGDFTIDNVLVCDGKIASIIDWSGGAFGDPRYDAALAVRPKPNAIETESEIDAFFEGYGKKIIGEQEYKYFENGLYAFF
ncbi:aminoglycoside phosphotransferase family protein [Paenibacillus eucommiae]|uniref:Aminoglycoside phosphotransferase (APT) family kinase protein n=1 Tax=Paenibacillus eucommiae TaxID=1355755 RepID=A0ABS4IQ50_9BACL|nr:aminoglycoside phosphotransferase family protein [Paenibacillus eucommiae]MBP1989638.1 aminoglycoside phosphotransferase (APT) family kinase protein [Paenibacillus eucommiae]